MKLVLRKAWFKEPNSQILFKCLKDEISFDRSYPCVDDRMSLWGCVVGGRFRIPRSMLFYRRIQNLLCADRILPLLELQWLGVRLGFRLLRWSLIFLCGEVDGCLFEVIGLWFFYSTVISVVAWSVWLYCVRARVELLCLQLSACKRGIVWGRECSLTRIAYSRFTPSMRERGIRFWGSVFS
jgi:hypothetical protein